MAASSLRIEVLLAAIDKATGPFRKIATGGSQLTRVLRESQSQLKKLETQQDSLSKHRELEIQTARTSQQLMKQRRALDALHAAYSATENPTAKATKALVKQTDAVGKLARAEQAQRAELTQSRTALAAAGLGTDKLAAHQARLAREITQTNRQIDQQRTRIGRLARAQETASKLTRGGMVATAHGAGFYAAGNMAMQRMGGAAQPGIDLQASMRDISITGGFDKAQEAALTAQVRADALKFGQTAELISGGLKGLVANGVNDVKQLGAYSGLMAKTTVATGAEMTDLAQLITTNNQILGISAEGMRGALDSMNYAGKRGSFELADMAKWFPALAPQMKALGITGRTAVDSLGAALQVARKGAGSNDEAANNLSNYLGKLTAPDTIKAFDKAGINLERAMLGMARKGIDPLQGSLQLITRYMESKGPAAALKFKEAISIEDAEKRAAAMESLSDAFNLGDLFRDKQVLNFLRPALANQGEMQSIKAGASKASGGIDADWIARMGVAQQKLTMFQIKLTELKLKAFDVLAPSLTTLADKAGVWLDKIGGFVQAHPVLTGWILKGAAAFALLLAAIGLVLIPLGFLGSMLGHSITLFTKGGPLLKDFGKWLAKLGPHALRAGAFVGRAAGSVYAFGVRAGTWLATKLLAGSRAVLTFGLRAGTWLATKLLAGGRAVYAFGLRAGSWLASRLLVGGRALLAFGANAAKAGWALMASPLGIALGLLALAVYMVWKNWDAMKAGAILVWQDISRAVVAAWEWIKSKASAIWDAVGARIRAVVDGVKMYLSGAWSVITGIFSGDGGKIRAGLQLMWNGINAVLGGWPARLLGIGRNVVQGLINGISGMAGAVRDALGGIANGAVTRLKNLLGIKSPSRVFAALGGHTMAGFTQGLLGGEQGAQGALQRIGAGLRVTGAGIALGAAGAVAATPVSPALPAFGPLPTMQARVTPQLNDLPALQARIDNRPPLAQQARGAAGGDTIHYNITIHAAPGTDGQDLSRMVRDEIERLDRQRNIRKRSQLSDYDSY